MGCLTLKRGARLPSEGSVGKAERTDLQEAQPGSATAQQREASPAPGQEAEFTFGDTRNEAEGGLDGQRHRRP